MNDDAELAAVETPPALQSTGKLIFRSIGAALAIMLLVLIGVAIGANFWPHVVKVEQRAMDPIRLVTRGDLAAVPDLVDQNCPAVVQLRKVGGGASQAPVQIHAQRKTRRHHASAAHQITQVAGFFVSPSGYLLSSATALPDGPVEAVLSDGRVLPATREGQDALSNLALFKVDGTNFPTLSFADDGFPRIGQTGIVIAAANGNGCTVRSALVTADYLEEGQSLHAYFRMEPPPDPGWAGSPVLNLRGQVIGVAGLFTGKADQANSSMILPASTISRVSDQLVRDGSSPENAFGFEAEDIGPTLSIRVGADPGHGAIVSLVAAASAADKGGLKAGDVIVAVGDDPVSGASELARQLDAQKPNVTVTVQRGAQRLSLDLNGAP